MSNQRIKSKTIVITGASGGLGKNIAYACAKNGANLVLLARNLNKLEAIKYDIEEHYGVQCDIKSFDVSEYHKIDDVFETIYREKGTIDVLVNNAGFGIFDEVQDIDMADVEGMFNVNVVGLIACTRAVVPNMQLKRSGHIINIASQAGKMATPKSSVYSATKHAVLGFTNGLRMEMSRFGVYVTAVNPGPVATNFFNIADKSGTYMKNIEKLMLNPEKLALKIVDAMFTKRREINAPGWMNASSVFYSLFPKTVETIGKKAFFKK
ncbi:SDR family NAD(P)-dependent oxidoreductase [Heyndrickxia ginsengihumi]|uniref:Oxidoreductase n=1 Tax=Heyndrickxia ginsengihumi TaxID=363870 RepID=A0A0A6Y147_9BACI|nr:SDR family oxidoreductase [Heyndrickxia ginsengihumi]KHD86017.1 oxidoreductase [Heyndrickxia ginsengihumi]MBE6182929.1 SDR family oxidoreductase [Bacillus sp. (in: firmicutes)]MCM3022847.1 SDR family oxidoreductase [Heyndrickxia ginsengihumi]NEY20115.1 SDR family oxidoreductase [Heyndrickxia ginsengihumi]